MARTPIVKYNEDVYARLWQDCIKTGDVDLVRVYKELTHTVETPHGHLYYMAKDMMMCLLEELEEHGISTIAVRNNLIC